jgi:hypothetical protein
MWTISSPGAIPPADCHGRPNCLNHSKGPCALQKAVRRAEHTGCRECQDEPSAAALQRISDQHSGHREQSEQSQGIHSSNLTGELLLCTSRLGSKEAVQRFLAAQPGENCPLSNPRNCGTLTFSTPAASREHAPHRQWLSPQKPATRHSQSLRWSF